MSWLPTDNCRPFPSGGMRGSSGEHIKEALVKADVLHQNETGLYVKGVRYWMHVACTAQARQTSPGCDRHLALFWGDQRT